MVKSLEEVSDCSHSGATTVLSEKGFEELRLSAMDQLLHLPWEYTKEAVSKQFLNFLYF